MTDDEKAFIKDYRKIEDLEREKEIKFFQCIGDPPITPEFRQGVHDKRSAIKTEKANALRERDVTRFATAIDEDKVVVETDLKLSEQPKWDAFANNHLAMRKRICTLFMKAGNKVITRLRAGKRLTKIKAMFERHCIKNREETKKMVAEDWKIAQNMRLTDSESENDIHNIKFSFNFNVD